MTLAEDIYEFFERFFVIFFNYLVELKRLLVPPGRKSVRGQVALVTGAGHGIGREIALELAKHGAVLVLWDVHTENNEQTAQMVRARGGTAHPFTVDVANQEQIAQAAKTIRTDIGEVDILVNNAGSINCAGILDLTARAIRKTFEVNILGSFWTVREFLPAMLERKRGHICNICSMNSFLGSPLLTDYCASKGACHMFSLSLRKELKTQAQDYVRVTAVYPVYVTTGFIRTVEFQKSETLTPSQVAVATVDGILRNYDTVFVPFKMGLLMRIVSLFPTSTFHYIIRKREGKISPQFVKDE